MEKFKIGDLVEVYFDTGCMGASILYGKITAASEKQCFVVWESGLRNRLRYSYGTRGVKLARDQQLASEVMKDAGVS